MENKIDDINRKILRRLQENSRESFASIGRLVGLTPPAVAERVKKMEDLGILEGYKARVNHLKMGYQLRAIVTIKAFMGKLKPFLEKVRSMQEVINCYRITGNENIIMEVVLLDQLHLEQFIDQLIQYGETRTHIILSDIISDAPIMGNKGI
ncbi:Lrp/AsnC family transcriptional regulator [Lentiprolixibacter aurantiacus]|uniref:Lrp/AsnC family transcriptional regulator n=1 Tax=Lentiprolixibacter aurantiacus TaxID=2993939 RepID=A0AAE3MPC2_9FLAO|nr:Lrp/AsnC family transcriptional regulator [Lentiprolixibacter aurantiacus]MCX2720534.1 Lrp/AsnC family transcriptional regulator [Lentiprolixibacter aurantiacus]